MLIDWSETSNATCVMNVPCKEKKNNMCLTGFNEEEKISQNV
jgi:hypothetical protein